MKEIENILQRIKKDREDKTEKTPMQIAIRFEENIAAFDFIDKVLQEHKKMIAAIQNRHTIKVIDFNKIYSKKHKYVA